MLCRQVNEVFSFARFFGKILPAGWRFFQKPAGLDLAEGVKNTKLPLPASMGIPSYRCGIISRKLKRFYLQNQRLLITLRFKFQDYAKYRMSFIFCQWIFSNGKRCLCHQCQHIESHKDRHEKIGEGSIGLDTFSKIINHLKLRHLPFYLETPNELDGYAGEIKLLRGLYKN